MNACSTSLELLMDQLSRDVDGWLGDLLALPSGVRNAVHMAKTAEAGHEERPDTYCPEH